MPISGCVFPPIGVLIAFVSGGRRSKDGLVFDGEGVTLTSVPGETDDEAALFSLTPPLPLFPPLALPVD